MDSLLVSILTGLHVLVAVGLITLVLLQQGQGAGMGAAFGSGASGTVFGARGAASFLTKTTAVLATIFFLNSVALAYLASHNVERDVSVLERVESPATEIPAVPDEPAQQIPAQGDVPGVPDVSMDNPGQAGSAGTGGFSDDVPVVPKSNETKGAVDTPSAPDSSKP